MSRRTLAGVVALLVVLTFVSVQSSLRPLSGQETQGPDDVKVAIQQADELLRTWRETGKTEESKAKSAAALRTLPQAGLRA
jgi:hypothetical protein